MSGRIMRGLVYENSAHSQVEEVIECLVLLMVMLLFKSILQRSGTDDLAIRRVFIFRKFSGFSEVDVFLIK